MGRLWCKTIRPTRRGCPWPEHQTPSGGAQTTAGALARPYSPKPSAPPMECYDVVDRRLTESPPTDGTTSLSLPFFASALLLLILGLLLAQLRCGKTRTVPTSDRSDTPVEYDLEAQWPR